MTVRIFILKPEKFSPPHQVNSYNIFVADLLNKFRHGWHSV